jgi:hypothetical protein
MTNTLMEFDERTQSFIHPTIPLKFYKKDVLQEIEDYLLLIPDPIKFRHLLDTVLNLPHNNVSDLTKSVLINSYVIFPCIRNYEEISLNFIFLLYEKYKDAVKAEFEHLEPDVFTMLFLGMYNCDDYTIIMLLAKFKLFIAKCAMLGFSLNADVDKITRLITDMKNSSWSLESFSLVYSKRINVKFDITLHLILLFFLNGYNPYNDFPPEDVSPKGYVCVEKISEGNLTCDGDCIGCRQKESVLVAYELFLMNTTLVDLIKARNSEWRPIISLF